LPFPDTSVQADAASLLDSAACGLLLTQRNGTILQVNETFCQWVGHGRESLVGRQKIQALLTVGGRIFHQTHWAPLLQMQGSVSEVKLDVVHRAGHTIPMVLNAICRQHEGESLHQLAIFVATDRHQYERELLKARQRAEDLLKQQQEVQHALSLAQEKLQRAIAAAEDRALFAEQMIGIVSHDLRNPLSIIKLAATLIARGDLDSSQARALAHIGSATERSNRLIGELLDFTQARIGSGLSFNAQTVDLHEVVSQSVEELSLAFPDRKLVHERFGGGDCEVDADRLAQLIGNLVANAIAYGAADGTVRITSRVDPTSFSVSVHNDGTPIPDSLLPVLFEPMTRGTDIASATRSVGLGLFIVRAIALTHGGDMSASSTHEAGTTFTAQFPRAGAPRA
jgi:sigma-B regulation protein RsbU (phosphoserine phosphatase)